MQLKTRPIRILWHGEFSMPTGFANVTGEIIKRFYEARTEIGTRKYEVAVMALGPKSDPFDHSTNPYPFKVFKMVGDSPFGQQYAAEVVRRFKPDIIVTLGDIWMSEIWNDTNIVHPDLRKTFKLVGYVAIDGYPVPQDWIEKFQKFDKFITFTKFGKDAIDERAKSIGKMIETSFIYHGIDTNVFKKLPKQEVEAFKAQNGKAGKKIIGMFSRNQPRKHHPEFVELAYEILEQNNNDPNILFYFHCVEADAGWNLPELIKDIDTMRLRDRFKKYGKIEPGQEIPESSVSLLDRFFFPGFANPSVGLPPAALNMMYNICDVHVLLTSGEGWGLTTTESLAAGVPTLANDYAASTEILTQAKNPLVKARDYTYRGHDHNFIRPHTDYAETAKQVMEIVNSEELKIKYGKSARAFALGNQWDIVIEDWYRELDDVFNYDRRVKYETI